MPGCSGRRRETLGEDQVDGPEDARHPLAHLLIAGPAEGDTRDGDPLLCSHDPLLHGRGLCEKGRRDLDRAQPGEETQNESGLLLLLQRRMRAGEEETETLIRDLRGADVLIELRRMILVVPRSEFVLDPQSGQIPRSRGIEADEVDRSILRRAHQPGGGLPRDSRVRPGLDRPQQSLLQGLFCEIEIVEPRCQGREQPPVVLFTEDGESTGGRRGFRIHQ